jgi:hypothetical protein
VVAGIAIRSPRVGRDAGESGQRVITDSGPAKAARGGQRPEPGVCFLGSA